MFFFFHNLNIFNKLGVNKQLDEMTGYRFKSLEVKKFTHEYDTVQVHPIGSFAAYAPKQKSATGNCMYFIDRGSRCNSYIVTHY